MISSNFDFAALILGFEKQSFAFIVSFIDISLSCPLFRRLLSANSAPLVFISADRTSPYGVCNFSFTLLIISRWAQICLITRGRR